MGGTIKRRTFLKTLSLSSITLMPGADILGRLVAEKDRERFNIRGHDIRFIDYACNILQFQNLLYLKLQDFPVSFLYGGPIATTTYFGGIQDHR